MSVQDSLNHFLKLSDVIRPLPTQKAYKLIPWLFLFLRTGFGLLNSLAHGETPTAFLQQPPIVRVH